VSEAGPSDAAVVLTPAAAPEALAAGAAIQGLRVDVVPTPIGCLAVCAPKDAETVARGLSMVLRTAPVVLIVQRDGQMTASRWQAGAEQAQLAAALVLDGAPREVEDLLLGAVAVGDLAGVVSSDMSRWRAARTLASAARSARKQARS
jgi:hypothetical protein